MDKKEKIKVLYIDDESNNLFSFKASFRFDYDILTAISPDEAKKVLAEHDDISVILSDQRMPEKTGVEFFEEIHQQYPGPIRILITGYTDIESVISAINRGHIFRYIKKPWEDEDVRTAIEEGYKFFVTSNMLAQKNTQLQKAYDELDKFSYNVTHDMRGPIMSVLGAVNLAKQTDDIGEVREMLDMMEKAMMKFDHFIQSIHDYYSLKRGELNIHEIDFNAIATDLHDMFDITGKMGKTKFDINVQQSEPFRSDEMSLKIVLNNLVANAFKYQRKGNEDKRVELTMRVEKGNATIEVKDNGIGIPESSLQYIFDMFYRATAEETGSGFGLYNAKDALNKINGQIEVQSTEGQGTTFTVTIPTK